jgi:ureidoglycolate lyase
MMKLVRFGPSGAEKPGMIDAQGRIRDLSHHVTDISGSTLGRTALDRLRGLDPGALPLIESEIRFGPCVGSVSKIIGVGLNFRDHAEEIGAAQPKEPVLFAKPPSSICGPNDDIIRPQGSERLDWEVELGVVIGERASRVEPERSLDYVAGYCVFNDITERGWIERSGQMLNGKSADTFSPIGPWLVTADEIADPQDLDLFLDVNGIRRQTGNTRTMFFDIRYLVSHISRLMTLMPGDIVTTGTPPGIGMRMMPPVYLQPGDTMRLGVAGLGEQVQRVVPTG